MNLYQIAPAKDGFQVTVTSRRNRTRFSSNFQTEEDAVAWVARRQSVDTLNDAISGGVGGRHDQRENPR
jgi:hypothetical protein